MIYFECYSDQAFLTGIGIPSKNMEHSFSKGNVCNKLQKNLSSIGLVDEDPNEIQPKFIRYLIEAQRIVYEDQYLTLFSDPKTKNKLILIRIDQASIFGRIRINLFLVFGSENKVRY